MKNHVEMREALYLHRGCGEPGDPLRRLARETLPDEVLHRPAEAVTAFRRRESIGKRFRLVDEHDRDPLPDLVAQSALPADEVVFLRRQMHLALALRAGQYFKQFLADSHFFPPPTPIKNLECAPWEVTSPPIVVSSSLP
jgi:hypothetical protein